ncbi:MAG TPA: cupin domain-containing protein [Chloroflexota bacterium]|nr:cupin domain-containing protein [Chloroflexota bacterium]
MIERERERVRQREYYDQLITDLREERERSYSGKVVVRAKEEPWVMTRQALVKYFLWPSRHSDQPPQTALDDWIVFVQDIKQHSGKHRHQGGLVIYILEGEGYSVVEGERHDWEAGDLLLLPMKPGGVEHQHFNKDDARPAKWIAFICPTIFSWGGSEMVQMELHPEFQERSDRG